MVVRSIEPAVFNLRTIAAVIVFAMASSLIHASNSDFDEMPGVSRPAASHRLG
jgi:hypothetical protein